MKKVTLSIEIEVPDEFDQDEQTYELVQWLDDAKFYHIDAWMSALSAKPEEFPTPAWKDAAINVHKDIAKRIKQAMGTIKINNA